MIVAITKQFGKVTMRFHYDCPEKRLKTTGREVIRKLTAGASSEIYVITDFLEAMAAQGYRFAAKKSPVLTTISLRLEEVEGRPIYNATAKMHKGDQFSKDSARKAAIKRVLDIIPEITKETKAEVHMAYFSRGLNFLEDSASQRIQQVIGV